jgi:L,D-transpeptidase catalytic domain
VKVPAAIAALAVLAVAVVLIDRGGDASAPSEADAGQGGGLSEVLRSAEIAVRELSQPQPSARARGAVHAIARVQEGERIELRDAPDGRVLETVGDTTEFGSARAFWIARVRGDWLGVPAAELANGELAWIEDDRDALELFETRYSIAADVSDRELELRHGRRVLDRFPVTVGSPSSPTPLGRYSITDALAGPGVGPYYGCCVLALTGHQPRLPADWIGGDRIAIHGTPGSVGGASSAGCLRASDPDLVSLFARVPLGAPVFIRA